MHEHTPDPAQTVSIRSDQRCTQTVERCACGATRAIDHMPRGDRATEWTLPAAAGGPSAVVR